MQTKGIYPEAVSHVVQRANSDDRFEIERVGKVIDPQGFIVAEKLTVIRGPHVITVFRARPMVIGDFMSLTYDIEKYPVEKANDINTEIRNLRSEWTSGIFKCGRRIS